MEVSINYRETLFKRANLTTICGKPTFETIHKLRKKIKSNAKYVYSNLGGGTYGNLSLVLTDAQYSIISNTPLVYPTHSGPLIITEGTTSHMTLNMRIMHSKEVRLFCEVMGVEQDLIQYIITAVGETYLTDIRNRTTKLINDTVAHVLTHLQDNYGQLMTHELLQRKDMVKNTIHRPRLPIASVFSVTEELLDFSDITGTSYCWSKLMNGVPMYARCAQKFTR